MATALERAQASRRKHPFGQFGTTDDECSDNGALGCTHAAWRFLAWAYTGRWYSHDQLSSKAGYPCGGGEANRGMRISESQRLARNLGIPLVYKANLSSSQLLVASRVGPVLLGIRYGNWPNWAHYKGVTRPKPWARPLDAAGRNQFAGFFGGHAVVLLGYRRIADDGKFVRNDCYVFEPNHDSPARPQNVPYDVVTQTQLNNAYQATRTALRWSSTMAFIPSRAPTFPGGL